jgi:hypothetical protein
MASSVFIDIDIIYSVFIDIDMIYSVSSLHSQASGSIWQHLAASGSIPYTTSLHSIPYTTITIE